MDLERLSLHEVRMISRVIDLVGVYSAMDDLESAIRVLEATSQLYRKQLTELRQATE
jgi:hypothetical protein